MYLLPPYLCVYEVMHDTMGDDMDTEISLPRAKALLTTSNTSARDTLVLFLPGLSGEAFSTRFAPLVSVALECSLPTARVHAWQDADEVKSHTWSYYHKILDEVLVALKERGFQKIIAVGKSFGGGLLLSYHHSAIVKKILWAPAIGMGEDASFETLKDHSLADIPSFLDLHLAPSYVQADTAQIRIIHGTADTSIPLENSRRVIECAQDGLLIEVPGADHSFKSAEEERALMEATRSFLL